MTPPKKPNPPSSSSSAPMPPGSGAPQPERVRVDDVAQRIKRDPLPLLYLLGFVILGATLFYLYKNPATPPEVQQAAVRVEGLQGQVQSLTDRLAKLEARPGADTAALDKRIAALEARPVPNLAPLEGRMATIEGRAAVPPVNLSPLEGRIAAVEGRPVLNLAPLEARIAAVEAKPPFDPAPLTGRLDTLAAKQAADTSALGGKLDALGGRLDALDGRVGAVEATAKQTAGQIGAVAERSGRVTRLQAAMAALDAGQRLGEIPGAPPPVARFALDAPPTENALRRSFDAAAEAALHASQPAIMDDKSFGGRLWTRAQQAVSVRQGDRVLLGDPLSGAIGRARAALDAGDLAGAVKALDNPNDPQALAGPAKAAMADWIDQAHALLDARAALSTMLARS